MEVVGTLVQQALKSSQGEDDWLRFFQLMGSAIALDEESATVPTTPSDKDSIKRELKVLVKSLRPADRLQQYSQMLRVIENSSKKAKYYLLDLRMSVKTVNITGFIESDSQGATAQYMKIEQSLNSSEGDEAVLVSVDSIEALRKAYPNYFLDTGTFVEAIKRWCK